MLIIQFVLGCASYAVAALILIVDTVIYWLVHRPLKYCADHFLSDGDSLTGWSMKGAKENG